MKKVFSINDKDFQCILDINKEGGDRVMYLSGGLPLGSGSGGKFRSTQEKINDFWKTLGEQEGFNQILFSLLTIEIFMLKVWRPNGTNKSN